MISKNAGLFREKHRTCARMARSLSSFVPIYHAGCSAALHRDLLPPLLNSYHVLVLCAIVAVLLDISQLEVATLVSL